jgi:ABC-type glycerol-3-phosphate transport system substrate-binding protein
MFAPCTRRRALTLSLAPVFAACQRLTGQPGGAETPRQPAGPLKLSLAAYASGATVKPYETIKARFESQHPQSEVELMLFPAALGTDSLAEKIVAMTAAGTPPDVFTDHRAAQAAVGAPGHVARSLGPGEEEQQGPAGDVLQAGGGCHAVPGQVLRHTLGL